MLLVLIIGSCKVSKQAAIACCGIDQKIESFKADTNFDSTYYHILITKGILKPISKSEAPLEIRYTNMGHGERETLIIRCIGDSVQVNYYKTYRRVLKDSAEKYELTEIGTKDIGNDINMEINNEKTTTLLRSRNLNDFNKKCDWNGLFRSLIDNHLFDVPGNTEYFDPKKGTDYGPDGHLPFIEVKLGTLFRNIKFDRTAGAADLPYDKRLALNNINKIILRLIPSYRIIFDQK